MKKITLLIILISLGKAYAQQPNTNYNNYNSARPNNNNYNNNNRNGNSPDNYNNSNRVNNYNRKPTNDEDVSQIRIVDSTQEIQADVTPYKTDPKIRNDRYYYWYLSKVIHSTQGGYSGQLLNGHYIAFYPDKNLKEEGDFKRGLKDGEWKTWDRKGSLTSVTNWDEGILAPDNGQPFWKKIPFVNKKDQQQQTSRDSTRN